MNQISKKLLGATVVAVTIPAATVFNFDNAANAAGFQGDYDPSNWTETIFGPASTPAFADTTGAPDSISLTGGAFGSVGDPASGIDFTITALTTDEVSFDWSMDNIDPNFETFGYLLNGVFTILAESGAESGSTTFSVMAGDVFGFRQQADDSGFAAATTVISNFQVGTPSIPEPSTILSLLALTTGASISRLRKNS